MSLATVIPLLDFKIFYFLTSILPMFCGVRTSKGVSDYEVRFIMFPYILKGQWLYSLTHRKISFTYVEINKWAHPPGDDLAAENKNYKTIVYVYVCAHACVCILFLKQTEDISKLSPTQGFSIWMRQTICTWPFIFHSQRDKTIFIYFYLFFIIIFYLYKALRLCKTLNYII